MTDPHADGFGAVGIDLSPTAQRYISELSEMWHAQTDLELEGLSQPEPKSRGIHPF